MSRFFFSASYRSSQNVESCVYGVAAYPQGDLAAIQLTDGTVLKYVEGMSW